MSHKSIAATRSIYRRYSITFRDNEENSNVNEGTQLTIRYQDEKSAT